MPIAAILLLYDVVPPAVPTDAASNVPSPSKNIPDKKKTLNSVKYTPYCNFLCAENLQVNHKIKQRWLGQGVMLLRYNVLLKLK